MTHLIRLVYVSRSTFTSVPNHPGLNPDVARILAKSRKNNARLQVVGGLLFGDGNFLQCLEGEVEVVEALYGRIEADPRHRDVTMLARQRIEQRSFGTWSMKYVPGEQSLAQLMRGWGMSHFDPYQLSPQQTQVAVQHMLQGDDTVVDTQPGALDDGIRTGLSPDAHPSSSANTGPRESIFGVLTPSPGFRATAMAEPNRSPRLLGAALALVLVLVLLAVGGLAYWLTR